jgi:hypothetical protein
VWNALEILSGALPLAGAGSTRSTHERRRPPADFGAGDWYVAAMK